MPTPVTDPALLQQLNGGSSGPVTDPALLAQLNGTEPTWTEDIAKTILPSAERGIAALATTPQSLADLFNRGVGAGINYLSPTAGANWEKARELASSSPLAPPTYNDVQNKVEKVTGPLYQPKTLPGKIVGATEEIAPSIMVGGGSLPGKILGSVGAGAGSQLAGAAATGLGYGKYAPVAETVGGLVGGAALPRVARSMVTPFPASDRQNEAIQYLGQKAPNLKFTAGQKSGNPTLMNLEGANQRSTVAPSWVKDLPENQKTQFTEAAMNNAGMTGTGTQANLGAEYNKVKQGLDSQITSARMSPQNFAGLNNKIDQIKKGLINVTGPGAAKDIDQLQSEIMQGASGLKGGPTAMDMLGPRYQYLRGHIQNMINGSGGEPQRALSQIRDALDNAMYSSLPDGGAALKKAQSNLANAEVLVNGKPFDAEGLTTPKQVHSAVSSGWGNKAYNTGRGDMSKLANAGERVMKPLPTDTEKTGNIPALIGAGMLGGPQAVASHLLGLGPMADMGLGTEGAILGSIIGPQVYNAARQNPLTAALLFNPVSQRYLGNQVWRNAASPSVTDMTRALMVAPSTAPTQ